MSAPHSTQQGSGLSVQERLNNYKPTELRADLSHLTNGDKQALVKLADVSDLLDAVYYKQIWSSATQLREQLKDNAATGDDEARDLYKLFELFRGPWDRSMDNEPFIEGVGPKPKSAGVYPEDMTATEFDSWVETLSAEDKKRAHGFYDIIQRYNGNLRLIEYAQAYQTLLQPAAKLMREAAHLVSDQSFAEFLRTRGDAFESNKYLESEVSWLNISHTSALEAAIGPYEVYQDELFSAKAFFESMIHVRDFKGSQELDKFTSSLELVEKRLPIPDEYRNTKLVPPPIVVVNQVYNGGDTAVPMTAAYNLPNDEDAIEIGGSKLTLIKNVQEGKFASVLLPIAQNVLRAGEDMKNVNFDAFFTHVLLHEVAHSNGPHKVKGTNDTVRSRLQELYSAFEEAKADITGLFAANLLVEDRTIDNITMRQFYTTYLASAFRSIRFGLSEAHGLGQAMQLNYLLEKGGFTYSKADGKFGVDMDKITQAVSDLTRDIMLIQGDGDKQRAIEFKDKYGNISAPVKAALDSMKSVPIDIAPIWVDINNLRAT
ncbi:MutT/nudix family protein [Coemansia reversa NRRL 1564]|uniref:MutT/nudix family protein n=1 Tax=Coemansia reversa (strain ATCC 12441 / NRRL 1564) TaxID=763665 RepID=A0A2G5B9S4_COERN|nr:MutT/nudix family protein [Coemansia reversa NRRL 1564]|eukprot:PIA15765.1 MutT/nudix family protein [Coemansia reversa NRRL 1564]